MEDNNILLNSYKEVINEEIDGKDVYVYHCAKYNTLQSIGEVGFERYFTAGGVGNAYGPGIYSTFSLQSSIVNAQRGEYGDVILKCKVKSLRNFLIYNDDVARKVYGAHHSIDDQLKKILPRHVYEQLKNETRGPRYTHFWQRPGFSIYDHIINNPAVNIEYTSNCCHAADWYGEKNPEFNNAVDGFIFVGPHDGNVCILRDFKIAYPVEVSFTVHNNRYDTNIKWQPFKTHENFEEFAKNDIDLVRMLKKNNMYDMFDKQTCKTCGGDGHTYNGSYCAKCFGTGKVAMVPDYFSNGFARVMMGGKYNYLYRKNYTHGVISPVGFDRAPLTFSDRGTALVSVNNEKYIIKLTEPPIKFLVYDEDGNYLCPLKEFDDYLKEVDLEGIDWGV